TQSVTVLVKIVISKFLWIHRWKSAKNATSKACMPKRDAAKSRVSRGLMIRTKHQKIQKSRSIPSTTPQKETRVSSWIICLTKDLSVRSNHLFSNCCLTSGQQLIFLWLNKKLRSDFLI